MKWPWAKGKNNVTNFSWWLAFVDELCVHEVCVRARVIVVQSTRPLFLSELGEHWNGSL